MDLILWCYAKLKVIMTIVEKSGCILLVTPGFNLQLVDIRHMHVFPWQWLSPALSIYLECVSTGPKATPVARWASHWGVMSRLATYPEIWVMWLQLNQWDGLHQGKLSNMPLRAHKDSTLIYSPASTSCLASARHALQMLTKSSWYGGRRAL